MPKTNWQTGQFEVVEVNGAAAQGATAPWICRTRDGSAYYVKGRQAGYSSLAKEWVAGNLGRLFGLPIPRFVVVHIPEAVRSAGPRMGLPDMGAGPAFGSLAVGQSSNQMKLTVDLTLREVGGIGDRLKRDLAVFD